MVNRRNNIFRVKDSPAPVSWKTRFLIELGYDEKMITSHPLRGSSLVITCFVSILYRLCWEATSCHAHFERACAQHDKASGQEQSLYKNISEKSTGEFIKLSWPWVMTTNHIPKRPRQLLYNRTLCESLRMLCWHLSPSPLEGELFPHILRIWQFGVWCSEKNLYNPNYLPFNSSYH